MAWTDEERALTAELWKQGLSASQIAKRMEGKTRNAVIGVLHRAHLSNEDKPQKPRVSVPWARSRKRKKSPPAPDAPAEPAPPLVIDGARPTIATATNRMCRWIDDEPARANSPICGAETKLGEPWCAHHKARCWPPKAKPEVAA